MGTVPEDWFAAIPRSAGLKTLDQWREALVASRPHRAAGALAETVLLPVLELLARGPEAGANTGQLLLGGASLAMWGEAERAASRNWAITAGIAGA